MAAGATAAAVWIEPGGFGVAALLTWTVVVLVGAARESRRRTDPTGGEAPSRAWVWPAVTLVGLGSWWAFGHWIVRGAHTIPGVGPWLQRLPDAAPASDVRAWAWIAGLLLTAAALSALVARYLGTTAAAVQGATRPATSAPALETGSPAPATTSETTPNAVSGSTPRRTAGTLAGDVDDLALPAARWCRLVTWVAGISAALALARALGRPLPEGWWTATCRVLTIVLLAEATVLTLREMIRRGSSRGWVALLDGPLLRWTASRANPLTAPLHLLGERFGIDLRSAWALQFVRRALPRVTAALVALAWISTTFQQVGPTEQALHFRFGRLLDTTPREPGLHLVLPWPVDRLQRVPVHRTLRRTLGYAGETIDQSLLWTSRHAREEYSLLLGDGRDLVAVNGVLSFRVRDPRAYLVNHQQPLAMLAAIADRELLRETQGRSLDGVLSENLEKIAARIETGIQDEIDRHQLGIAIVELALIGLHPPVDVAPDYQAVVGSSIQRETFITEGLAYRDETLPLAESEAVTRLATASADGVTRLANARGEAGAFDALELSHRLSPTLFEFRKNLEALEQALETRPFVLIDDRIERDGGSLWILD